MYIRCTSQVSSPRLKIHQVRHPERQYFPYLEREPQVSANHSRLSLSRSHNFSSFETTPGVRLCPFRRTQWDRSLLFFLSFYRVNGKSTGRVQGTPVGIQVRFDWAWGVLLATCDIRAFVIYFIYCLFSYRDSFEDRICWISSWQECCFTHIQKWDRCITLTFLSL